MQQQPEFEVSVACRRDLNAAQDFAERHAIPHALANADELIASPLVDAVCIATPPSSHLELALKVAAANKPCYVEKPMTLSHGDSQRMVDAFA